jgi:hypothetical protein
VTTKEEIVNSIAQDLGVDPPKMSTGSTEPREIFELINDVLGLGIEPHLSKPEFAREIVKASGSPWNADCESSGSTVTRKGLLAVAEAVRFFTGQK